MGAEFKRKKRPNAGSSEQKSEFLDFDEEFTFAVGELELKPFEFWILTFAEFFEMVDGYVKRERRKTNERTTLAWNTANFNRARRLPDLKTLLIDEDEIGAKPDQTDEQMFAMVKMLNAAWGGVEVKN